MSRLLVTGILICVVVGWFVLRNREDEPKAPQQAPLDLRSNPRLGSAAPQSSGSLSARSPRAEDVASPEGAQGAIKIATDAELSWTSMPSLGRASGPARSANYIASFEMISDSCGNMPSDLERDFETGLVDGALVIQFGNASWACELTGDGSFECPTLEEAKTESDGKVPHLERSARGVWRVDASIEIQVQTRTWCEGSACDASPCQWSFTGIATMTS